MLPRVGPESVRLLVASGRDRRSSDCRDLNRLPVAATAAGALWMGTAEMLRLGNEHVSGRLRSFPFRTYFPLIYGASFVIFWLFAWSPLRSVTKRGAQPTSRSLLRQPPPHG